MDSKHRKLYIDAIRRRLDGIGRQPDIGLRFEMLLKALELLLDLLEMWDK